MIYKMLYYDRTVSEVLMLKSQGHLKKVLFATIGIF